MLRPNFFCKAMDCVLTEIFMIRRLKEKRQIMMASKNVVLAKQIKMRKKLMEVNAIMIGTRLWNFETSQPEMGRPNRELIGISSRRVPNSASLY